MLVLVTLLGNAPVAGNYDQMVVSGSALCCRRRRKCRAVDETGSPCSRSVASMVLDLPRTLFFYVSRKRVTSRAWRKTLAGAS